MTNQKFLLLFTFLLYLLLIQTINSDAEVDAKSSLTMHERIRRRVYGFYHHPELVASAENGNGNGRASSLDGKPSKFQLKCPRTSNKNISSVTWSLNGQTLFTVNFAEDGRLEVVQSVAGWQVEEKVWRALEDHFGMILAAKKGRYRVEVENGGPRGQWIMLRINEPKLEEDQGEWKCQVFINDKGIVRLEAESRKRIEERIRPRKAREFSRTAPMRVDAKSRWEMWQNRLLEGRTFGFAKSDGEFAVFERVESAGNAGIGQPLIGDSIEYTRNDSPRSAPSAAKDKLEDDEEEEDISMNSPWRWRRARSGEDRGGALALPLPLITGLLIQLLIAFI